MCPNSHLSFCLTLPSSDNYGFVTYRYAEEAFAAIESGHKLRQADEQPFDLCFGGRRQFCKVALVRFAGRLIIMILWSMPTFQEQTRPYVTQSG